jgi:hypothetical protein
VGVRESRRIHGKYMLTEQDIMGEASFDDAVALGAGPMDRHEANGSGILLYAPPSPFEIPLRVLLPVGVQGLLASGRNICSTRDANAGTRHMATSMALGEAAGYLAAIAAKTGRDVAEVPASEVQANLAQSGALFRRASVTPVAAAA